MGHVRSSHSGDTFSNHALVNRTLKPPANRCKSTNGTLLPRRQAKWSHGHIVANANTGGLRANAFRLIAVVELPDQALHAAGVTDA
ncbi:hypothetical protein [Novipirellula galeiformis]|nr:hypothetical protein [Novipirellula galeiformis]